MTLDLEASEIDLMMKLVRYQEPKIRYTVAYKSVHMFGYFYNFNNIAPVCTDLKQFAISLDSMFPEPISDIPLMD
jgi:hypothetical protein